MKSFTRSLLVCLVATGAVALTGCGKKEEKKAAAPAKPAGSQLLMGKDAPKPAAPAPAAPAHADATKPSAVPGPAPASAPAATVPLDVASAEGAMKTWLGRLQAGDFRGAAEACDKAAPGHQQLLKLADNMDAVRKDVGAEMANFAIARMADDMKQVAYVKKSEDPTVVVYDMMKGDKKVAEIQVGKSGDAWRVVPPPSGMPQ